MFRSVDPAHVFVEVEPPTVACGESDKTIPVILRLRNGSKGYLKIWVDSPQGPPYDVSWLSYEVVVTPALGDDWRHGPGGHGPVGNPTLRLGPGDATTISVNVYDVGPADYGRDFRIRLLDNDDDLAWMTDAFRPCVSKGA